MTGSEHRTISIVVVFFVCGTMAALLAWVGPFMAPDIARFAPEPEWSSMQFHSLVIGIGVGAGAVAAGALILIRRLLPAQHRSRIVWMPRALFDRKQMKKEAAELLAGVAVLAGVVLFIHYGPPRFWRDFEGMSEAEVRERLGEPFRDSRSRPGDDTDEFTLGWYQGFEVGLFLTFRDNVVVSQERITR